VKAVRYLDSLGRRFLDGIGVLATAVPAHYLYARMLCEPAGERFGAPIGQYVHHLAPFQIHQHGAPASSAPKGEVVYTQDPRCLRLSEVPGTNVLKQGVAGDRHSQFAKQPRPGLPSKGKGDMSE
jgi:hypothetical protein